ncbi:NAD(P)H-hydrate dehydratase [Capnocytophaga sp.]|uniref:NAD(P)H-hydrate dehydratase n=1 Tax=Capnocytophaga sp. TaxID=44737 RepID=UPI0026DD0A00|nr:NAD(P)H-hydrate dehydratase [Capnocytophaga sp.]MDO5105024.1 NAD(P)H-hydrate dehydratase [Capnocytophaga sp.]
MKILFTQQLRQAYQQTIKKQRITRRKLMERAAKQVFLWLQKNTAADKKIVIYAGVGNNGGDGLAVARMLVKAKREVEVNIVNFNENPTDDFLKSLGALVRTKKVKITDLYSCSEIPEIQSDQVVVDAVFGMGFNRYVPEWIQCIFEKINHSKAYVVSIDIPSGFYADKVPLSDEVFVKPDVVLTFQSPKLIFLLPQTGKYIPHWEVLDVELDVSVLKGISTDYNFVTKEQIQKIYKPRGRFSHKGSFGHALLVGGSYGKVGAMVLGGTAVLRAGAGLLTMLAPKCAYDILQTAVPEAMVITSKHQRYITSVEVTFEPSAIGVGVGMETHNQTAQALFELLEKYAHIPFVIDADALNILAQNPDKLSQLPENTILTPHIKELERLIGTWKDDFEKLAKAKKFAKKHKVVLIIKEAYTITTNGTHFWVNSTGNAGLATAGSGDVLTGILTGLLSQGYTPLQASILGVYLHGKSGDRLAQLQGQESLTASDLCKAISLYDFRKESSV